MRYTPLALAICMFVAVGASTSIGRADAPADPRVERLLTDGRATLAQGDVAAAVDRFEAALALAPGYAVTYIDLAATARANGLQGRAIRYYRQALMLDPANLDALAGEGAALAEKGALAKAEQNLVTLRSLCGADCAEAGALAAAIALGPVNNVQSAQVGDMDTLDDAVKVN
ncbi:hypothetical protein RM533_01640 [Croceicoccus sp. F390]|uniref:Tetratricopeptide repeat protein n=1 Tax=Croceicoccus esteveae TaxID=3075597 RepID=A0ABU2ZE57_9SPHN|nr:hypothetical protein [Croceicoccus sp. F390]MDT0574882.1 hypothetical protein [Croceicoccus sp. F390]